MLIHTIYKKSESYFESKILYDFDLLKIWVNVSYLENIKIYAQMEVIQKSLVKLA